MVKHVLLGGLGDGEHVGTVGTGEAESALVSLVGLCHEAAISALEHDDVGDGAVVAAVAGAGYAGVDLLLDQVSLALAADSQLRLVGLGRVDPVHARHRV